MSDKDKKINPKAIEILEEARQRRIFVSRIKYLNAVKLQKKLDKLNIYANITEGGLNVEYNVSNLEQIKKLIKECDSRACWDFGTSPQKEAAMLGAGISRGKPREKD